MAAAKLYPPRYSQNLDAAVESVTVTLLNLARPSAWDEVSDWLERERSITNSKLREIWFCRNSAKSPSKAASRF